MQKHLTFQAARSTSLCACIALFNLSIGVICTALPAVASKGTQNRLSDNSNELALIRRTGMHWLFFACVATYAAFSKSHSKRKNAQSLLSMLHLMDAPADLIYTLSSSTLKRSFKIIISSMVPINLGIAYSLNGVTNK